MPYVLDLDRSRKKIKISAGCPSSITRANYYNRVTVTLRVHHKNGTMGYNTNTNAKDITNTNTNAKNHKNRYTLQHDPTLNPNPNKPLTKIYTFSFLLNCDLYDLHKNFEYGYIFLSVLALSTVVIVSMHPRIYSLRYRASNLPVSLPIRTHYFVVVGCLILVAMTQMTPEKRSILTATTDTRFQIANAVIRYVGLAVSCGFVFVCSC